MPPVTTPAPTRSPATTRAVRPRSPVTGTTPPRAASIPTAPNLLYSQLYSDWGDLATHPVPDGSQYEPQRGELIGMYRCLASYMGCLGSAWQVNISIGDDAIESSVDEFMEPLRAEEVNGENRYITEFRSYYEGFAL